MNPVSIHKRNLFFATSCLVLVSINTPPVQAGDCCELSEDPTTATSPQFGETLGSSVAIDGTLAVAGAPLHDQGLDLDVGRAVVFSFTGSAWVQDDVVEAGDAAEDDTFGFAVATDGGVIVVGSPLDDHHSKTNAGSVYVFELVLGDWTQVAKLTIKLPAENDIFGWSVAISGDTIIASARGRKVDDEENAGAVYWFDKPSGGWADKEGEDFFSEDDLNNFDAFGFSIALDGDVAIVGAPG